MTELGINGLAPGFKYDVRVRGIFDGQAGEWSPTYEIDVFSDTSAGTGDKAPAAVTDLTVTPTIDSFIITWTAPIYNADGTVLNDMKDYILEVSDVTFGTADATYLIPEHNKPKDLSAVDRAHQFEFTYKMNKELYGTATPTLYARIYARDTTNNRSAPDTANATNAAPSVGTITSTPFGGGINLTWTAGGADTVEYVLQSHTASMANPPVTGTEIYRGKVREFNHITTGLRYYRVGAVDIFGQTTWSAEDSETAGSVGTDTTPPAVPTALADAWQGTSYVLTWTPPADLDVVRYQIDIRNNGNTVTKTFYSEGPRFELSLQDNINAFGSVELDPFYVRVWAIDASGNISATYTELNAAATDAAPAALAAPVLATPVIDAGGIYISWPAVSDTSGILDSYELYGTGTGSTTVVYTGNATFFRYALPSAYSGTYYFRARTRDKFGRYSTSYSTEVSIVATSTLTGPTSTATGSYDTNDPTNRTAQIVLTSISGPSSPILAGFKVRYRKSSDTAGQYTEIDINKSATTYIIRGLSVGVAYTVEMASYDVMGRVSGTWVASTGSPVTQAVDTTAPAAPTSVTLTTGATSLMVAWTGPSDTDFINGNGRTEIQIATNSGFTTGKVTKIQPGGLAGASGVESFTGLTPGTPYWARVRTLDAVGNPTTDTGWVATTPASITVGSSVVIKDGAAPASSPSLAAAGSVISGINGVHVRWSAVANTNPVTYEVHVGTASGFTPSGSTKVGEIDGTYMFVKTDGSGAALAYSTDYFFKIIAKDVDGSAAAGTVSSAVQLSKADTADINANAITATQIATDAVIAAKIKAGEIDTNHINATGINANKINIGGNASNMVPQEWADFELTSTMYDSGGALRPAFVGTPTLVQTSATQFKFGARALAVTVDAASEGVYFNTSATTYNIPVLNGKTYIISAYVYSTITSGTGATLRVKPSGGADTTLSNLVDDTTASTWTRVYGTYTAAADTTVNISIIFAATSGVQYIDGVMMEERVGTQNTPSGFVKPGTVIDGGQIVTGTLSADKITTGTLNASQVSVTNLSATNITTGTLDAARIATTALNADNITTGTLNAARIAAGSLSADKVLIGGQGNNLLPPQWSDFEWEDYYYVGKMDGVNATALASTEQEKFGSQSIKVVTTVQPNNTVFLGVNNTDYNFRVLPSTTYIISGYIYQGTGSTQTISFRYKPQSTGLNNDYAATVVGGTTAIPSGSWQRIYASFTTGASDDLAVLGLRSFSAVGTYYIDGMMIEKQVGYLSTPSPFTGAALTVIDGNSISTGSLATNKISLGLFGSNLVQNGSFEDTGVYPRVKQRSPVTLSNSGTIPGWTTARIGGDSASFHSLEWGDYSTDDNLVVNPWFEYVPVNSTNPTVSTGWATYTSGTVTPSATIDYNGSTPGPTNRILFKESTTTNRIVTLENKIAISTADRFTVTDLTNYTGTQMVWGSLTATSTTATDLFTTTNPHTFENGDSIFFSSLGTTTGVSTNTTYYIINATSTTFQLSASPGGAALDITGTGSSVTYVPISPTYRVAYTAGTSVSDSYSAATPNGYLSYSRTQKLNPTAMASGAIYGVVQSVPIAYGSTSVMAGNFKYNISSRTTADLRFRLTGQIGISSVTTSGTNLVTVTTVAPHGLATSDSVEIEGVYYNNDPTLQNFNGAKTITVTGTTTFTYATSGATNGTWSPRAAKVTDTASMVQSAALTTTGSWQTSPTVNFTANGFFDSIRVAILVVATAATSSMNTLVDTATLKYGTTAVTDPFTFTSRARSGLAKAVLGKGSTTTTHGTSLTSDPVEITADSTYNLGFYYYGDINQQLQVTFEYSATLAFGSPTVTVPTGGIVTLTESLTPATAGTSLLKWDSPGAGYVRAVFKNTGTAEKGLLYIEDVWLSIDGRTSGELTDAGIRLFDEHGNETVSLMADSSDSGDFIKLGGNMVLDGATSSIQAEAGSFTDDVTVGSTSLVEYLTDVGRGVVARGNRSSNQDFVNAEVPHTNWSGGVTYSSGVPYLEVSADNLDSGRMYKISAGPFRIYNTNANTTFVDVMVGYRFNATTIPAIPRADTSAGLDDVIMKYRLGKQANQNITMGYVSRIFNPPTSGNYRFLIYGGSDVSAPGGTIRFDGASNSPAQLVIEDVGINVAPSGVSRTSGTDADTRKITKTVYFSPKWWGYYGQDGALISNGTGEMVTTEAHIGGEMQGTLKNSVYTIYDQLVSSTDTSGVYPDSSIVKVEMELEISTGEPNSIYFQGSTGATTPYASNYPNSISIPNLTSQYSRFTSPSRVAWFDISNMGTKSLWGTSTTGTRYRGVLLSAYDGSPVYFGSEVMVGVRRLRITYNVVE